MKSLKQYVTESQNLNEGKLSAKEIDALYDKVSDMRNAIADGDKSKIKEYEKHLETLKANKVFIEDWMMLDESFINEGKKFDLDGLWSELDDVHAGYDRSDIGESGVSGKNKISFIAYEPKFVKTVKKYLDSNGIKYSQDDDTFEINESFINEAEVTSDEDFMEYGKTVLQKAHGDDYDEDTANDTLQGILDDNGDDYGACIGVLTSSLGEGLENIDEAKTPKVFTVKSTRRDRDSYNTGTIDELIKVFSYTLEVGASWQHERGNKKINRNPKTIQSLVDNLNNAANNSAANGNGSTYYQVAANEDNPKYVG